MTAQNRSTVWILMLLVAALSVGLGVWVAQKRAAHEAVTRMSPDVGATVLPQPRPLPAFALVDQHAEPFTRDSLEGHWTFMFFGYTHCPDICPDTLVVLNALDKRLAEDPRAHADTQVVFVSVDPERDTPELLSQYVPYYNPSFVGVGGDPDAIQDFTRSLGIMYMRAPSPSGVDDDEHYLVDHTASILLIDPQARLHALFSVPHEPERMARAFATIRQHYRR
jgi:protein SCO1